MAASKTAAREGSKPPAKGRRPAARKPKDAPVPGANLWQAGLKAINNARQDAERRHASVVETLLGFAPARRADEKAEAPRAGFPGLDAFGMRKFEDVFDERVLAALERLGMPTRDELLALHAQLDQVLAQMARLEAIAQAINAGAVKAAKPAAARRAPKSTGG